MFVPCTDYRRIIYLDEPEPEHGPPHGDPSHICADPKTGCQDQRFDVEVEWGNFEHDL